MPSTSAARQPLPAVVRPSLVILGGLCGALLGSVVARVLMARALAPEELGTLILALAWASALGGVASLGLSSAAGRRIGALRAAGDEDGARRTARTAATTALVCGSVVGAALLLAAPSIAGWFGDEGHSPAALTAALRALAPIAAALPLGLAAIGISRGFGRAAGRSLIRDGGGGLLRAGAVAAAVALGLGLAGIALSFALAVVVAEGMFLLWCVRRGWLGGRSPAVAGPDRPLLSGLRPFAVLELLNQVGQWMDILLLAALAPAGAVGYYGVARSVHRGLEMALAAPMHAFLPAAAAAAGRGDLTLLAAVYRRTRLVAFALLWLPLGVCLLAPELPVVLLFGPAYAPSAVLLRLLALVVLVDGLVGFIDQTLVARGGERAVALLQTASLAGGFVLLILLAPHLGATGAALALLGRSLLRAGALVALLAGDGSLRRLADHLPRPLVGALLSLAAAALVLAAVGGAPVALRAALVLAGSTAGALLLASGLLRRG